MAKIDLPCIQYSCDGEYTPETLVSIADNAGLKAIAITDHNTTMGVDEGIEAGKKVWHRE